MLSLPRRAVGAGFRIRRIVVESEALYRNPDPMHPAIPATLFQISRTPVAMCSAGVVIFFIGLWAAKSEIARARGLDKIVALSNLCFAVPLAVFGSIHFSSPEFVKDLVRRHMSGRMFLGLFRRRRSRAYVASLTSIENS